MRWRFPKFKSLMTAATAFSLLFMGSANAQTGSSSGGATASGGASASAGAQGTGVQGTAGAQGTANTGALNTNAQDAANQAAGAANGVNQRARASARQGNQAVTNQATRGSGTSQAVRNRANQNSRRSTAITNRARGQTRTTTRRPILNDDQLFDPTLNGVGDIDPEDNPATGLRSDAQRELDAATPGHQGTESENRALGGSRGDLDNQRDDEQFGHQGSEESTIERMRDDVNFNADAQADPEATDSSPGVGLRARGQVGLPEDNRAARENEEPSTGATDLRSRSHTSTNGSSGQRNVGARRSGDTDFDNESDSNFDADRNRSQLKGEELLDNADRRNRASRQQNFNNPGTDQDGFTDLRTRTGREQGTRFDTDRKTDRDMEESRLPQRNPDLINRNRTGVDVNRDFNASADTNASATFEPFNTADLGVQFTTTSDQLRFTTIQPNSVFAQAGFRPGDTLLSVFGQPVSSLVDFRDLLLTANPGDQIPILIQRGGHQQRIMVDAANLLSLMNFANSGFMSSMGLVVDPAISDQIVIDSITPNSFLRRFGFQPGDIITSIDGQPVTTLDEFGRIMLAADTSQRIPVGVTRDGSPTTLYVTTNGLRPGAFAGTLGTFGLVLNNRFNNQVVISTIQPGTIAARIGLQPGDVILSLNGERISTADQLNQFISGFDPNTELNVEVWRRTRLSTTVGDQQSTFTSNREQSGSRNAQRNDQRTRSSRSGNSNANDNDFDVNTRTRARTRTND